jgi:hypothetical protein
MKVFVIFGSIEFTGGNAYVYSVNDAAFMEEDAIERVADTHGWDYLMPHYYDGQTIFHKFHKETK